ncbi:uncharacterized protein LOC107001365 [Solanum pennellii]|uniref:Uncharacterized protein LOC107001365 n=1 Tax=Solanum pennellii TaxID=28526 RepID=A0ABM1FCI9_SOLPN|nr:uncharacterized protein LOC107001365 [Solanum pennellii]
MSRIVTGVLDDLQEECHSSMLHDNVNISRLIVHAKHLEEAISKRKSRDAKRAKSFDRGSSKNRIEIQDKARFRKRVYNQVSSKFPKASGDRVDNLKLKKEKCTSSPTEKPICGKCGKKHYCDCLKGTDNCFSCGKSWHKVRDYPNVRGQDMGSGQAQARQG